MINFEDSFFRLKSYVESENFSGYDPYDTLNSWIPFKLLGKWPGAIATQVQKRNPVNIRPLIGIKKEINPKAFGLFLHAYSILYMKTRKPEHLEKAGFFYDYLRDHYTRGYSGFAWGYNFPWASPVKFVDAFVPSAVVTGFVCRAMWHYYQATKKQEVADILLSASEFVLKDLSVYADSTGKCISYTTIMQDICYNSSLLAAEVIAIRYRLSGQEEYRDLCKELVNFVVVRQKPDGKWMYSENKDTGAERHQIDFHQGYVLESLYEISRLLEFSEPAWEMAIRKGIDFYRHKQFQDSGQSLYRLPKEYPVDIHFQSQGIIVFSKLHEMNDQYHDFAGRILQWTIDNMQSENGGFYYRKFRWFTDKTNYMRWNQAWMFLAFVNYFQNFDLQN